MVHSRTSKKFDDVPGFKFSEGMVESGSAAGP